MSRSLAPQVKSAINRRKTRGGRSFISGSLLDRTQHARDRAGQPQPPFELGLRGAPSFAGQLVELGFSVVLRRSPFGLDQALLLHAVQSRIERSLFDLQHLVRQLVDTQRDAISMVRAGAEALENQQVERALEQVDLSHSHAVELSPRWSEEQRRGCSPRPSRGVGRSVSTVIRAQFFAIISR